MKIIKYTDMKLILILLEIALLTSVKIICVKWMNLTWFGSSSINLDPNTWISIQFRYEYSIIKVLLSQHPSTISK